MKAIYDSTKRKISSVKVANAIKRNRTLIFSADNFYLYENGCYKKINILQVEKWIKEVINEEFTSHKVNEIIRNLRIDCFVEEERLNDPEFINLKNGLLDLKTVELLPHSPLFNYTIQLNVNFDLDAKCDLWLKTVNEIFENCEWKIELFQEFFGLCLTREQKYRKALFCVGEGKNGKSTLLETIEEVVGEKNRAAVEIELFSNRNYIAQLHNVLVNVTNETNSKSEICDSRFKAVVSGDSMQADHKFGHPFMFRPFCKIIVATNNMPRVDDKTDAFFDRLLILPFERIFLPHEQDRELKFKLRAELDGIFKWALEGLKRLRERGYFNEAPEMTHEIQEFRKDNNNVLVFVTDACELKTEAVTSKARLYKIYHAWCKENGYLPLGMGKFGKELKKQYKSIFNADTAQSRNWGGIGLQPGAENQTLN